MKKIIGCLLISFMIIAACNSSQDKDESVAKTQTQTSNDGVFFVNLADNAIVKSPVFVEMGVKGMDVEPAGEINPGKGHHHIIIDGNSEEEGMMVPADSTHIHYGKGQTSDSLLLSPGKHTLTLQFANGFHQSYGKDWSKTISITVEE